MGNNTNMSSDMKTCFCTVFWLMAIIWTIVIVIAGMSFTRRECNEPAVLVNYTLCYNKTNEMYYPIDRTIIIGRIFSICAIGVVFLVNLCIVCTYCCFIYDNKCTNFFGRCSHKVNISESNV